MSARTRIAEHRATAAASGLRYVAGTEAGFRRERKGRGFVYRDTRGRVISDPRTLDRIRKLAPPAWTSVWICARADGHLQATGRDARGRKQHRYHPAWSSARSASKFEDLIAFARALPAIRTRVRADLRKAPLSREHVLAAVVTLLEKTLIRIGNKEYARANRSFGLTTLRDDHVRIGSGGLTFEFRAKSGIEQRVELSDPGLARVVRRCRDLPGRSLFQYVDDAGVRQCVDSVRVNRYLRDITGQPFTAKTFRTWAATVLAARALCGLPACTSDTAFKRNAIQVFDTVAARLGNTRAVCRQSYVHPGVLQAYHAGMTIAGARPGPRLAGLSRDEAAVVGLLDRLRRRALPPGKAA